VVYPRSLPDVFFYRIGSGDSPGRIAKHFDSYSNEWKSFFTIHSQETPFIVCWRKSVSERMATTAVDVVLASVLG
jgi:hypothetical protein